MEDETRSQFARQQRTREIRVGFDASALSALQILEQHGAIVIRNGRRKLWKWHAAPVGLIGIVKTRINPMLKTYNYTVKGIDADARKWEHSGSIEVEPAFIYTVMSLAMLESFRALTEGKAVFGEPGKGCRGPYSITEFACRLT